MSNSYIEGLSHELPHPFRAEAERLSENFEHEVYIQDGVVRWKSNDTVPPKDVLEFWQFVGKQFDAEKSLQMSDKETQEFLDTYKKRMDNHKYSEEELAEMRAAFGIGTVVVDVVTKQKIKL